MYYLNELLYLLLKCCTLSIVSASSPNHITTGPPGFCSIPAAITKDQLCRRLWHEKVPRLSLSLSLSLSLPPTSCSGDRKARRLVLGAEIGNFKDRGETEFPEKKPIISSS
jgi:hypothetical protein